jgi:hypothetical protein
VRLRGINEFKPVLVFRFHNDVAVAQEGSNQRSELGATQNDCIKSGAAIILIATVGLRQNTHHAFGGLAFDNAVAELVKDNPVNFLNLGFFEVIHNLKTILPQPILHEVIRHCGFGADDRHALEPFI